MIPLLTNSKIRTKEKKVGICQKCGNVVKLYKEQSLSWAWVLAIIVFLIIVTIISNSLQLDKNVTGKYTPGTQTTIENYLLKVGSKKIIIQNEEFTLNTPVIEIGGCTYLPLRFFAERLNAKNLKYEPATETITFDLSRFSTDSKSEISENYSINIGSKIVVINDKDFELNAPAIETRGNTYLPLRFLLNGWVLNTCNMTQILRRLLLI